MEKKTTMIIGVAIIAIVVIAAAAFVLTQNGGKDYNAQELAAKFVKDYDGEFGEFTIATGGSADLASLSYTTTCMLQDGTPQKDGDKNKTRDVNFQIYHYETKELAEKAFTDFITNSKNGSKGGTLLTQTDKLGMASNFVTIINGSSTVVPTTIADNTTYKEVKASNYGCDRIYVMYAAYQSEKSAEFTQLVGAFQDGKNVVVFNQTSSLDIYLNKAIKDTLGSYGISQADYENELLKFVKAF